MRLNLCHTDINASGRKGLIVFSIILMVILFDQFIKVWIKTHFYLGEEVNVFSWFRLLFVENNGMAFGMEIGSKPILTLLRIGLAVFLIWYIVKIKDFKTVKTGYLVCLSLIVAGAIGNIIDCVFYGKIFNDPLPPQVAQLFPDVTYGTWLNGKVVDMLYFPLFEFDFPQWIPFLGGEHFLFFQPVFNIADAAITVGILILIFFYSSQIGLPRKLADKDNADALVNRGVNSGKEMK